MPPKKYGGFWKRFLAYLIDEILLGTVSIILMIPFLMFLGMLGFISPELFDEYGEHSLTSFTFADTYQEEALVASIFVVMFLMFLITFTVNWLYHAIMESSTKQATLGKMAISLKVTDMEGNRITFARATGRFFAKILSGLIFNIGYIIAGFTEKKQALHDMIAGTLVMNKEYETWEKVQNDLRAYEEEKRREMEKTKASEANHEAYMPKEESAVEPEDAVRAEADEEIDDTPEDSQGKNENETGENDDQKKDNT